MLEIKKIYEEHLLQIYTDNVSKIETTILKNTNEILKMKVFKNNILILEENYKNEKLHGEFQKLKMENKVK